MLYIGHTSQSLESNNGENTHMKNQISKLFVAIKGLAREEGQDLVEYALVVALIAFAATVGMGKVASNIEAAFTNIANAISANIT